MANVSSLTLLRRNSCSSSVLESLFCFSFFKILFLFFGVCTGVSWVRKWLKTPKGELCDRAGWDRLRVTGFGSGNGEEESPSAPAGNAPVIGGVCACVCRCVRRGLALSPADITTHDEATSPHAVQGAHARSTATPAHTRHTQVNRESGCHGEQERESPAAPPAPGRARSTPSLIGRCFLIMQIICVDPAASCLTSSNTGAGAQGSAPGELRREPRERGAGT